MTKRYFALNLAANVLFGAGVVCGLARGAEPLVDFNRDVRPVLSDNCFKCHGPDAVQRKADLRLDTRDGLFGESKAGPVIVPGKPGESELIRRSSSTDPEPHMPPAASGKKRSAAQID